ncbi:hypothetical protein N9B63_06575, partial [Akkermansiaceae bacterium]|nr:hypothetical protein [Akkermansiaceae bacterium]
SYPDLPVARRREEILEAMRASQVVVVVGETGSGKTTQLPKMAVELASELGQKGRIGCTQPRRLAATSVARRVAEECKVEIGKEVGWQVRFTEVCSKETKVKFMTDGILLAETQGDREMRQYDTIIIESEKLKSVERQTSPLGLSRRENSAKLTEDYVTTLVGLLGHAKKSPRSLKWMNDEKLPKPAEEFLPESIQPYSVALFKQETPATDKLCSQLLDAITNTYPDHPYAYNLKAALSDANGKPGEALKMLEIAYTKNPNDSLVLSNLAASYVRQDKKDHAIRAYKKLLTLKIEPGRRKEAEAALKELSEETK